MIHLQGLNERQKDAVLTTEGPLLIIAGAGAGKTKTVTHRILYLIKKGVAPRDILAITFTNKAAKEMKERVDKLLSEDKELNLPISSFERPFVSTFHALGVHIIKENAQLLGIPRHFTIFDKGDAKRAIKDAIEEADLDPKQYEPGKIMGIISRQKGDFVTAREYEARNGGEFFGKTVAKVWQKYEAILAKEKSLDFDDLLLKTAKLLESNPTVRAHYQNKWKYIHIDEYQDTNKVQYMISKLLAEKTRNICVVGDVDQTIYSWRGADIQNILNFEKDYPEAKVILLEENYRSTQTILGAANQVIAKNVMRKDKILFTKNVEGEKIGLSLSYDENEEANFIADKAKELIRTGADPREIAVLYRANFQSRVLEEAFLHKSIPYQILGVRFFDRKEVKDVLSYIKASLNPDGAGDMTRVINVPARGIGKVTLMKVLAHMEGTLTSAMQQRVAEFKNLLGRIKEYALKEKPSTLIKFIIAETGMERMYREGKEEDLEKLENIRELVTLATKYDYLPSEEGLEQLLSDAALATDQDELIKDHNRVKLMTVHASKGLEFDYVFIPGLEEDLFPHKRMGEEEIDQSASEEERRLFYVAITRARKKIYLSYAQLRTIYGSQKVNVMSEFVTDIDSSLLEKEEKEEVRGVKAIFIDF